MSEDFRFGTMASTVPKAWERESTFNDNLYDWIDRAPWVAISGLAHGMFFLLLAVIPWHIFERKQERSIEAALATPVEELLEEPPEEPEPELIQEEVIEEPFPVDADVSEHEETPDDQTFESALGDPDFYDDTFTDKLNSVVPIGIGGGGGKFGGRLGGQRKLRRSGGSGTEQSLTRGLAWLALHQDSDGKWDADGHMKHDPVTDVCAGAGRAQHDVGITGLATLAFLGDGHTTRQGRYKHEVVKAVRWLMAQQDFESGLFGESFHTNFMYDHSIATLAICEAYYFSKSPILARSAQKAVNFIAQARNPYGVWRYAVPPQGDGDSSITGWMVFALKAAEEAGLNVDRAAFADALSWFDEVSDSTTGRVGYSARGEASSREVGVNDDYPREVSEAMTAVGLLCRFFLGQDPASEPLMEKHAKLLSKTLPHWDEGAGHSNDMYYWYYGSYAMYQMGGKHWKTWNRAMKGALLVSQGRQGAAKGSWDPTGPWGMVGGRVYSTAMGVLCLEVYFRYSRVLGAR